MGHIRNFYRGEAHVDFVRRWRIGAIISAVLVLVSLVSLGTRQLNLGIEFEGGTSWEYPSQQSVGDVRDVLDPFGLGSAKIQSVGSDTIRVQADTSDRETVTEVTIALAESAGIEASDMSVSSIGPSWGGEITDAAVRALVIFFIVIAGYLAFRLEWRMAIAAIVAVVHDIIITVGVYSVFQIEVTPATVVAVLTILGFSLYDTVVVFDRAQENGARYLSTGRLPYTQVMAMSANQVLVRSINTSVVTLLPVVSMLVVGSVALGAEPLQDFAIALLVGLLVGVYSSIFVAAPLVAVMKEREPRWRQIRERYEARLAAGEDPAAIAAGAGSPVRGRPTAAVAATSPGADAPGPYRHPPRPRKGGGKGKPRKR